MKISHGLKEEGIVVGNAYDKYASRNPIVRRIMRGFESSLEGLVAIASPTSIHEVGCGEGYWTLRWLERGIDARGSDFSTQVIDLARQNAAERSVEAGRFNAKSIYDMEAGRDGADLVVCCEVLEHLEDPEKGLEALRRIAQRHVILSVPREPLWCALNMARGKYLRHFGNTPGHIQHWSQGGFVRMVGRHFDIVELRAPTPWTMVLCRARG